jgi:hypothetical protein
MSTLGSLMALLGDTGIKPYNEQELTANRIQFGNTQNQTQLLELADLKRQQETAARVRQAIQQDPSRILGGGGGGSLLASPALTAGGPMTQQVFGPGGMGPMQQVPAYPDASRYAGVSPQGGGPIPPDVASQVMPTVTPPGGAQSTLAGLAPQPRPDPLEAMFRTDSDAGLKLLDMRAKIQTQRLETGERIAGSIGRIAQGVNDQASLDQAREDIGRIDPRAAAQLPQFYSKAAMEPFIARALSVKDRLTLQIADQQAQAEAVKAQADMLKARQQASTDAIKLGEVEYKETPQGWIAVPKYPGANGTPGVGGTPVTVGGQPVTSGQEQQRLSEQTQQQRSAEFQLQGEYNKLAQPYREVRDAMGRIEAAGTTPTAAGDAALLTAYMKMLDPSTGVRNEEIRNAENVGGLPQRALGWLEWLKGGAPLQESVRKDFLDRAKKLYAQYQNDYEQTATQYREQATRQGLDPRNVVQDYRSTTPAGGRGTTVTEADIAATVQASGKTRQQVLDALKAKGYTVR